MNLLISPKPHNMKLSSLLLFSVLVVTIASCRKEIAPDQLITSAATVSKQAVDMNKELKIAVISDIHYMAPGLLAGNAAQGTAFLSYLAQDPKLLQYSDAILKSALASLAAQHPDILLIPGDLTKDGELLSHNAVASLLAQYLPVTRIFVIPGNHDINNPEARTYNGNDESATPIITKEQFATIYYHFGYANAIRDNASMSYLAKPYTNLWILAIDAGKYDQNTNKAIVDGEIKTATMNWIKQMLADAKEANATVLTMMHHNLLEHFKGETFFQPGYTVDNWETVAPELASAGVTAIFTGHYHANDITTANFNGKELIDIETGSLVNIPSAYRVMTLKNRTLDVTTQYVTSIAEALPGGMSFPQYSQEFLAPLMDGFIQYMLIHQFGVPPADAGSISPLVLYGFQSHLIGDEKIPVDQKKIIAQVNKTSPELAFMLNTLWSDINTRDNFVTLTLQNR
jgi:3',5'-cyclic AMP phosphodiesterase CpdA